MFSIVNSCQKNDTCPLKTQGGIGFSLNCIPVVIGLIAYFGVVKLSSNAKLGISIGGGGLTLALLVVDSAVFCCAIKARRTGADALKQPLFPKGQEQPFQAGEPAERGKKTIPGQSSATAPSTPEQDKDAALDETKPADSSERTEVVAALPASYPQKHPQVNMPLNGAFLPTVTAMKDGVITTFLTQEKEGYLKVKLDNEKFIVIQGKFNKYFLVVQNDGSLCMQWSEYKKDLNTVADHNYRLTADTVFKYDGRTGVVEFKGSKIVGFN